MNIKELTEIIKNEELDKYSHCKIGPPKGKAVFETLRGGSIIQGIYCDESGVFKYYEINDRGGLYQSLKNYTEDEACKFLLESLRLKKELSLKNKSEIPKIVVRKTYKIALSGITASISIIFLIAAYFVPVGKTTFYFLSSLALLIPLSKQLYVYALLTAIAAALLSLLMGPIVPFVPYALFFGLHPVLTVILNDKKLNKIIAALIKQVYFNAVLILIYIITKNVIVYPDYLTDYIYLTVIILNIIFICYDYLIIRLSKRAGYYIDRIKKS